MKLNFNLYCESGAIVAISNIMQKSCGLVVVGEVKSGSLSNRDTVCIQPDTKSPLYDEIKRIEIDHEEFTAATTGQLIGICLTSASQEELARHFAGI
jgi:GTPase